MRIKFRRGSWIVAPVLLLSFFAPAWASATIDYGLNVTVYDNWTGQYNAFNNAPPLPPTTPVCLETTYPNIDINFDAAPVCNIYEDFVVRFDGFITAPETGTYTFYMHGDDGTRLYLDGVMVENFWRDTGNGGQVFTYSLTAGQSIPLLAWYYENGGGAWVRFEYLSNNVWTPVPESWFSRNATPTTTTLAPYLNPPQNLSITEVSETSFSLDWDAPEQSNIEVERYAVMWSCDGWSTGYGIASTSTDAVVGNFEPASSCEFKVRADNDTAGVYSAYSAGVSGLTNSTTTTVLNTVPPTTTTTMTTTTTIAATTTTEVPPATTTTTTSTEVKIPKPTEPPTTTTSTTSTVPVTTTTIPVITPEITKEDAVAVATNVEAVKALTSEQASEVFAALDVEELTAEEAEKLIEAVQEAPSSVRESFEEEVNVFAGAVDTYVPLDSKVSVGVRRVIIAATTVLSITALPTNSSLGGSNSSSGGPGGGPSDNGRKRK